MQIARIDAADKRLAVLTASYGFVNDFLPLVTTSPVKSWELTKFWINQEPVTEKTPIQLVACTRNLMLLVSRIQLKHLSGLRRPGSNPYLVYFQSQGKDKILPDAEHLTLAPVDEKGSFQDTYYLSDEAAGVLESRILISTPE